MRLGIDGRRLTARRTGVGRYLERLLVHWSGQQIPFTEVRCFVREQPSHIESAGIAQFIVLPSLLPGLLWENLSLRSSVRSVDLLFGASYSIPFVCPVPAVVSNLGIYDSQRGSFPLAHELKSHFVNRYSARRAKIVIANSDATRGEIVRHYGIGTDKVRVIYPGIDDVFAPVSDGAELRTRCRELLGNTAPFFLFVGKLSRRRNIPELLQAFARVRAKLPSQRLVIVGDNHVGLPLHQLIEREQLGSSVTYFQHLNQEQLRYLYAGATAFVLPTTQEGFSFTILEALSVGTPVITVEHAALEGGVREVVARVERPNADALAAEMLRIAESPELAREMRERGRSVAERFSWARTAHETMNVLWEAANP